jgi:N-acetyl sugar amidotransferase
MDTSDPEITFDAEGICNHCALYVELAPSRIKNDPDGRSELDRIVADMKSKGAGRDYDCIVGLSGGVDSSYVAYQVKKLGLRALAVHLDNGWDSELAVKNIENIVAKLDMDLFTYVLDWEEFRDLQVAFFKASVVDIELLTDHAITAILYQQAIKHDVRYLVSGENFVTEVIMPTTWTHRKSDARNIKGIHKRFGRLPLRTFPFAGALRQRYYRYVRRIGYLTILDYLDYNKEKAMKTLEEELGWRYYGGKHYESIFTRFYQSYVLPEKFGIDKRKAHLSVLINSGQMSRDEALAILEDPPADPELVRGDKGYVIKKLGFTDDEFEELMKAPRRDHRVYPSEESYIVPLAKAKRAGRRLLPR